MLRLASDCTSRVAWHSFNNRDELYAKRLMLFFSLSSEEKGEKYHFEAVYWVFCKNNFMMNFRGEEKKSVEGASKVALTGDRFLTCFPSHLLWVKARRQSRIWRREKRGVRLEKMARAAGNRGNAILTGSGGELFICILNLSVLNYCGMGCMSVQDKRYISRQTKDTIS